MYHFFFHCVTDHQDQIEFLEKKFHELEYCTAHFTPVEVVQTLEPLAPREDADETYICGYWEEE